MNKVIKKCEVCGITSEIKKIKYYSKAEKYLCSKHSNQFRTYGRFLDNNSQSRKDTNKYEVCGDFTKVFTYDKRGNIQETFLIDTEDLDKVLEHKWRTCYKKNKPYIVTGNNRQYPITYLARYLLDYTEELEIDHIDGNVLNNKKSNLRIADRKIQCGNLAPKRTNKLGVRGVSFDKRSGNYVVDFSYDKKRMYLKQFKDVNEAVYARYMLELIINPYRYFSNDENIESYIKCLSDKQKYDVEYYVSEKVLERNMLR